MPARSTRPCSDLRSIVGPGRNPGRVLAMWLSGRVTAVRFGVGFIVLGAVLIILGAISESRGDIIHTLGTTAVVFGAVVTSIATEAKDSPST